MVLLLTTSGCKAPLSSKEATMKFSCASPKPQMSSDGKLKLLVIQNRGADFFSFSINSRAKKSGLNDLRATSLPAGDLEVRVWVELSGRGWGGVVLRRIKGNWSALQLRPMSKDETDNPTKHYPEPAQGWDEFWDRLVAEGILALPDSSCFKDYLAINDGIGYVVEINMDGIYRSYEYGNPELRTPDHGTTNPESIAAAKHMSKIACMIFNDLCPEVTK